MKIQRVDLIDVAQKHLAFLEDVEAVSDGLHQPHVIRNAIRRYETIWLPLVAENPNTRLEAPLDVHWVWHVHMLCPKKYAADCKSIIGKIPDHMLFLIKSHKLEARSVAEKIWSKSTTEPFDVEFNTIEENGSDMYKSKITYDIETASDRQKQFYYNVSLLHFSYTTFLKEALERYKKFVALKKKHKNAFLVPMYDIDLMWHTHQLCPLAYREDMLAYLGYIMDHDDSTTDRSPDSHLSKATEHTKNLWKAEYPDEPYLIPGVLYRGPNPRGELDCLTKKEIVGFYKPVGFKVTMIKVEVKGYEKTLKKKYKIRCSFEDADYRTNLDLTDFEVRDLLEPKRGDFTWESGENGFAHFVLNCTSPKRCRFIMNIEREDGIKLRLIGKSKTLFSMNFQVFVMTQHLINQQQNVLHLPHVISLNLFAIKQYFSS